MVTKKGWDEFKNTGLILIINQILHLFGWAIVFEIEGGKITNVYPARVKFRGFDEKSTSESYKKVTEYLGGNIDELLKEVNE